jgi:hypothetical protein
MVRASSWMPLAASAVVYFGVTAIVARDVVAGLSTAIAPDAGDPVFTASLFYWNATRLPFTDGWWQLPVFHPTRDTLAFSEHLLGLSVVTAPLYWLTHNPLITQNVMMLLTFPVCALAMYALVHRLTDSTAGAFVAGLAFAFAPYRVSQLPHVHVLAAFWSPLVLLGLHAYIETRRRRWLALYAGAWLLQVASNAYMLVLLSTLVGLWLLWFVVARRRWRDLGIIAAATAVAFVPLVPILGMYVTVHARHGFTRSVGEMREFSADLLSVLCAPEALTVWGWLRLNCRPEAELFPGVALAALAVVATLSIIRTRDGRGPAAEDAARAWRRRAGAGLRSGLLVTAGLSAAVVVAVLARGPWSIQLGFLSASATTVEKPLLIAVAALLALLLLSAGVRTALRQASVPGFYVVAALIMWALALGPTIIVMGRPLAVDGPFALLTVLPGVDGLRVPARFWLMAVLCLSIASGIVTSALLRGRSRRFAAAFLLIVAAGVLADGWTRIPAVPPPRPVPAPEALAGQTVIELVPGELVGDVTAGYRAITGGWKTVNGYSGYQPSYYLALRDAFRAEEDTGFEWFQQAGALHVIAPLEAPRLVALVARQPGAVLTGMNSWAAQYRLPPRPRARAAADKGEQLTIAGTQSPCSPELVPLVSDGDDTRPWRCGPEDPQELTVDLGRVAPVAMVIHRIGPFYWDFPRRLHVETSEDGAAWREARTGSVLREVIEGGFTDPRSLAVVLPFEPRPARFIRLRHRGFEPGTGWTVTEIEVWSGRAES